jgi:Flp pilus assembly protein TadD
MLEAYYGLLTSFDGEKNGPQQQLAVCAEALEVFPLDGQLLCALGNYLQNQGRADLACRAFDTAVRHGQIDQQTWHLREIAEVATVCHGLTLQLLGRDDEARDVLDAGVRRHPDSDRLRRHLIGFYVKHGQAEEALATAAAMAIPAADRERLCGAIRGGCEAANKNWGPALAQLQAAYAAGCEDPLCLRWLAVTLMANGHTDHVEPVLRRWQNVEPENAEVRAYLEALQAGSTTPPAADGTKPAEPSTRQIRIDQGQANPAASRQPTPAPRSSPVPPAVDRAGP